MGNILNLAVKKVIEDIYISFAFEPRSSINEVESRYDPSIRTCRENTSYPSPLQREDKRNFYFDDSNDCDTPRMSQLAAGGLNSNDCLTDDSNDCLTDDSNDWLTTDDSNDWLTTDDSNDWLTDDSKDWLTDDSKDCLTDDRVHLEYATKNSRIFKQPTDSTDINLGTPLTLTRLKNCRTQVDRSIFTQRLPRDSRKKQNPKEFHKELCKKLNEYLEEMRTDELITDVIDTLKQFSQMKEECKQSEELANTLEQMEEEDRRIEKLLKFPKLQEYKMESFRKRTENVKSNKENVTPGTVQSFLISESITMEEYDRRIEELLKFPKLQEYKMESFRKRTENVKSNKENVTPETMQSSLLSGDITMEEEDRRIEKLLKFPKLQEYKMESFRKRTENVKSNKENVTPGTVQSFLISGSITVILMLYFFIKKMLYFFIFGKKIN